MKLCVFQGTFNPIHNAHIQIAQYALDNFGFDKIIFIPAFRPPHKDYDESLTPHRLKMVELATENNPHFEVSDIEYKKDRISYTYLTIKELYKQYEIDGKLNFIIGTDAFKMIDNWYEAKKLKKLLKFIVFTRETNPKISIQDCDYEFSKMDFYDISSTEIRNKIKNNESIKGLVTEDVERYITKNGLYK